MNKQHEFAKEIAEQFISPLMSLVSDNYKKKYKADLWRLFEDALRISLYKKNLYEVFEAFKKNIPCEPQSYSDSAIADFLSRDEDFLKSAHECLRAQLSYVMLMSRFYYYQKRKKDE